MTIYLKTPKCSLYILNNTYIYKLNNCSPLLTLEKLEPVFLHFFPDFEMYNELGSTQVIYWRYLNKLGDLKHSNSVTCVPVPREAGGPAASDERPTRQNVWAAWLGRQGPGARQPETSAGQPPGPAEDPQVRSSVKSYLTYCIYCNHPVSLTWRLEDNIQQTTYSMSE